MANGQVAKINRERLKEKQISLLADLTAAIKNDKKVSSADVLSLLAGLFLFMYINMYINMCINMYINMCINICIKLTIKLHINIL